MECSLLLFGFRDSFGINKANTASFRQTYNFETIGGLEVIYDLTEPWGNKVKKAKYMGSELHSRQTTG